MDMQLSMLLQEVKFTKLWDCSTVLGPFIIFMTGKRSKMKMFNFFTQVVLFMIIVFRKSG